MVSPLPHAVCLVQPTLFPEASRIGIYEYGCALARLGVVTHVIASIDCSGGVPPRLHVHALGFPPVNTPCAWWRFATHARATIGRLVEASDVGLVHLFNPSPATYLLGWMLKRELRRPRIVYDQRTGGLGHRPDALLIDAMAMTAPWFADAMISGLVGADRRFHEVLPGVNLERFRPRERSPRPDGEFVFVYAGTLDRNRSLLNMLAAFASVLSDAPRARLVIAGDGNDQPRLEAFVRARSLGHAVRFLGKLPYTEVPDLLATADCGLAYVPDTRWYRPQPQLKTLEYFAAGLPTVAVGTAGNRKYWEGLPVELLTADDPASFAAGMRFALAERRNLVPTVFRQVAEAYGWDRITREKLVPLYRALLAASSRNTAP